MTTASPAVVVAQGAAGTEEAAREFATRIGPGDVILLAGDLAAGKTTFVRGLVAGLGGDPDDVSSPTFVFVQTYDCAGVTVHHVDLYRLPDDLEGLREIGLEDCLADVEAVVAIEWPRPALASLLGPDADPWRVEFAVVGEGQRRIEISRGDSTR